MLTYSFLDLGSDSLYEHLYKSIKNDIISGILKTGEKLPSKRSFAKNLGVSTITVENAYGQLMAEGYIYSIPKKGYYINDCNAFPENQYIGRSPETLEEKSRLSGSILQTLPATRPIQTTFPSRSGLRSSGSFSA